MNFTLVTGASSGIGEEFATQYAAKGHPLILVARSLNKLEQLADNLRKKYQIQIHVIEQDLSELLSAEELYKKCQDLGVEINLLINDAGVGLIGKFESHSLDKIEQMIILNILTLTKLTYLFLPQLKKNRGRILNVASQVAFQPAPYMAAYGATKAYVLNFTEALNVEIKDEGVVAMALCPGATYTKFFERAQTSPDEITAKFSTPRDVVSEAIEGLENNNSFTITGMDNKFMVFLSHLLPRSTLAYLSQYTIKDSKKK